MMSRKMVAGGHGGIAFFLRDEGRNDTTDGLEVGRFCPARIVQVRLSDG